MTSEARWALAVEAGHLAADLRQPADAPVTLPLRRSEAAARLALIRAILDGGELVDHCDRAAIGRRVTLREADGETVTYALVIPGDGDPGHGWLAIDTPLGAAILGRRPGDRVGVAAPAGERTVAVVGVA